MAIDRLPPTTLPALAPTPPIWTGWGDEQKIPTPFPIV